MSRVASFAELEEEFIRRAHTAVWCNAATVDLQDRPRSRILHPIWQGSTGWVVTRQNSPKAQHLAHNPYVSLAYIADTMKPVYVDCRAEWDETRESKQHVWDLFASAPPPLGYDPALIFGSIDHPDFGLLKLIPWRIELYNLADRSENKIWRP